MKSSGNQMGLFPHSENGSRSSNGTVGVHGHSDKRIPAQRTRTWTYAEYRALDALEDLGLQGLRQIGVSLTHEDGLNTYQGHASAISSRSKEGREEEFTLTACFDSETATRLRESLSGKDGKHGMEGAEYSLTIVRREPHIT